MSTYTLAISSAPIYENTFLQLSAVVKGKTNFILDLTQIDETEFFVTDLALRWGDDGVTYEYKKDPIKNYRETSILDEVIYGKIGGSVMGTYTHTYNTLSSTDIITYLLEIAAYFESGYILEYYVEVTVYPESFYDTIQDLQLLSTQILPVSANYTVANFEGVGNGYTFVSVLSD